jgi:dephospho-CoA kinase
VKVIAVTGGIACGKTTLVSALKKRGAFIIDADAVSRELTKPGGAALPDILSAFGQEVFGEDGELNRKALGDMIFADGEKREKLNGIIHPLVEREVKRQLKIARDGNERVAILDIPLLYEAHMENLCDEVWCAYLDRNMQLERLMARDHLPRGEALMRIESQMPLEEKAKRADKVINTGGSILKSADIITSLYEKKIEVL